MAGRVEHVQRQPLDGELVAFRHAHGHHIDLGHLAHHRDAVRAVAQRAEPGDVVGVDVRVHRLDQLEVELLDQLQVAVDPLQHRIDDQRLATLPAGQEIAVGAGDAVEQLAENHGRLRRRNLARLFYTWLPRVRYCQTPAMIKAAHSAVNTCALMRPSDPVLPKRCRSQRCALRSPSPPPGAEAWAQASISFRGGVRLAVGHRSFARRYALLTSSRVPLRSHKAADAARPQISAMCVVAMEYEPGTATGPAGDLGQSVRDHVGESCADIRSYIENGRPTRPRRDSPACNPNLVRKGRDPAGRPRSSAGAREGGPVVGSLPGDAGRAATAPARQHRLVQVFYLTIRCFGRRVRRRTADPLPAARVAGSTCAPRPVATSASPPSASPLRGDMERSQVCST